MSCAPKEESSKIYFEKQAKIGNEENNFYVKKCWSKS